MKHTAGCLVLLAALAGCSGTAYQTQAHRPGPAAPVTTLPPRPSTLPEFTAVGTAPAAMMALRGKMPPSPYNQQHKLQLAGPADAVAVNPASRSLMPSRPPAEGIQLAAAWPSIEPPIVPPPGPARRDVAVVNSRSIPLQYEFDRSAPNGPAAMELWFSRDGGPWQKHPAVPTNKPPFVVDVEGDGIYGFYLATSGTSGGVPPGPNEPADLVVEVDTLAPQVRLVDVKAVGQGPVSKLKIIWQAADKNPADPCVDLFWARSENGPWLPIITQYENVGFYEWKLPPGLPPQFHLRVEVADAANNVGSAESPGPVVLDGTAVAPLPTERTLVEPGPLKVGIKGLEPEPPSLTLDPEEPK